MAHKYGTRVGLVASWLVRLSSERAVLVRAMAGNNLLCSSARHTRRASLHTGVQMSTGECNAGGNPAMN